MPEFEDIIKTDLPVLEVLRHSTAHLLAQAVKQLFPEAKLATGPAIEDGFYYDFAYQRSFTPEDLVAIEKRMQELVKQKLPIERKVVSRTEALDLFAKMDEVYKVLLINELSEEELITIYTQGDFVDLCRGPHVSATDVLGAFKLTKLAGAYWKGDSKNEMLQRIYGTAWATKDQLQDYLTRLEEAEKRDHRKLGKVMDLFHMQEEAPGMVFWHGNGYIIFQAIIQYMRKVLRNNGYQEVAAPLMLDRSLWEKSGHWDKFGTTNMFVTQSEERLYAIKPMNCPGHILIFNQQLHSYRDLPLRLAEFGISHRNEASGTLHGLMRVRQFTVDDAHIFCTEEQMQAEIVKLIELLHAVYRDFGFTDIIVKLATRPAKSIGSDADWKLAEETLQFALNKLGINWQEASGEGAFYGPKIEFHLRDCLQRVWQCGTVQVDFSMPVRLGAEYVGKDGGRHIPVMIHRAILGSVERFVGILLEQYAGMLPLWLAPIQVVIMNITKEQQDYAETIANLMQRNDLRVRLDLRNEKISFKIREHTMARVPYLLVVGNREMEANKVAVRKQNGEDLGSIDINAFIDYLCKEALPPHSEI